MIHKREVTRRKFLETTGKAVAGFTIVSPHIISGLGYTVPSDKLNIAIIGSGGRGARNLNGVSTENIVILCDVNEAALSEAAVKYPGAIKFKNFRHIFDHPDDFDAVVVSICEHTHAFAVLPALQLRKHVYCEKPLTHNVWEAKVLIDAAEKAGVATQMGTQIHAEENYRRVVELIEKDAIGPVHEVHVWVSRSWGWQSEEDALKYKDIVSIRELPEGSSPVPPGLDWELWLGPAKFRQFNDVYFPGPKWYRWWEFGNGTMSDLGSHWIDLPWWTLKLDHPQTIEAEGPPSHKEIAPASLHVSYTYGHRGKLPPVKVHWYQGTAKPELFSENMIPQWANGVLFVGKKGMLLSDYKKHLLLPEEKFKDYIKPEPYIPASKGHYQEWIHACKTKEPTTCDFKYSGPLTIANHLGNVAYRAGKKIKWNPEKLRADNCPEADQYIRREYHNGWNLE